MNSPMPSQRKPAGILLAVFGLNLFLGCTSNSGKTGGSSSPQYAASWKTSRPVVMARRALPSGSWSSFEFTD